MSELSSLIASLKGNRKTSEIVAAAKTSRETWRRIERGQTPKFSTLMRFAEILNLDEPTRRKLQAVWVRDKLGDDARHFTIKPAGTHDSTQNAESEKAVVLFNRLGHADRTQLIKAMERPAVLRGLASLNAIFESIPTQIRASA